MKTFSVFKSVYAEKTLKGFSEEKLRFVYQHFGHQMSALTQVLDAVRGAERKIILQEIAEQTEKEEKEKTHSSAQAGVSHIGKN